MTTTQAPARSSVFVAMTDKFMSGWGMAKGKTNVFVIECDTHEQVIAVMKAAEERPEMKRVRIAHNCPKSTAGCLVSRKHFRDLGGPWLDYYTPAQ